MERQIAGEVRFDRISRALYSTDASVYQIEPQGVVVPRSRDDLIRIVQICARRGCQLTMRGGGTTVSWNRLARAVFSAMGKPVNIEYIDMPESIRSTYQYLTCAETAKIHAAGYLKPVSSEEDAVADYIRNYLVPGKRLGD